MIKKFSLVLLFLTFSPLVILSDNIASERAAPIDSHSETNQPECLNITKDGVRHYLTHTITGGIVKSLSAPLLFVTTKLVMQKNKAHLLEV